MRRILALLALMVAASPLAFGQATQGQSGQATGSGQQVVEQELMNLERELMQAGIKRDIQVLDRAVADDYTYTAPDGMVMNRSQARAVFMSGDYVIESGDLDDMKVRIYGDTAVVTGRSTEKSKYKGQDVSGQYRWTDVFVKQGGRWRVVATHVSRIASQQTPGQPAQAPPQQPAEKQP